MKSGDRLVTVLIGPAFHIQKRFQIGLASMAAPPSPLLDAACGATVHIVRLPEIEQNIIEFDLLLSGLLQPPRLNRVPNVFHEIDHFIAILFRGGIEL